MSDMKKTAPVAPAAEPVRELSLESVLMQVQQQHKNQIDMGMKAQGAVELVRSLIAEGYEIVRVTPTAEKSD